MRVSRPDIRSLLCKHIRCQTRKQTGRHVCSHAGGNYRVLLATSIQSLGKLLKIAYRFPERRRGGLWEGGERCAAQTLTRTRPCDRHFRPSSDRTCLGWKTSNPTTTYKHRNVGVVVNSVCVHVRTYIAMHAGILVQLNKYMHRKLGRFYFMRKYLFSFVKIISFNFFSSSEKFAM